MKRLLFFIISLSILTCVAISKVHAATTINLTTDSTQFQVNKPFEVTIEMTSDDITLGTDAVVNYDPEFLQLTSVTPATLYPNYSNVNGQTTTGTINISAVSDFTSGITPNGTFATITFTPLKAGTTEISLAFDPSNTALTGVIPFEGDTPNVLTQAPTPLTLTITNSSFSLNQAPTGAWRLPLTLAGLALLLIIIFLLMRRPRHAPHLPPVNEPTIP